MLLLFKQINTELQEVNMREGPTMQRLMQREALTVLMGRTGDGTPVTIRQLAEAAGCSKSTINALQTGVQLSVPDDVAKGITQRLGVDLLVLFAPEGRTTAAHDRRLAPVDAVSA